MLTIASQRSMWPEVDGRALAVLGAEAGMVADLFRGANHFDVSMAVGFSQMALRLAIQASH